jgi:hypothetical protein
MQYLFLYKAMELPWRHPGGTSLQLSDESGIYYLHDGISHSGDNLFSFPLVKSDKQPRKKTWVESKSS